MKKKKIIWLAMSYLMVLALLLASCRPAPVEEEKKVVPEAKKEVVAPEKKKKVAVEEEKGPRYGGVMVMALGANPVGFDDAETKTPQLCYTIQLTNEELFIGDWAKGPGGTGEASFQLPAWFDLRFETGCLAESWEMPDNETLVFHIRKGVHFHNKPPVNGRELTANDVAYSLNRLFSSPQCSYYREEKNRPTITAPDKWTVVYKDSPDKIAAALGSIADWGSHIIPREMVEKYGDMKDWRNACGTGPFILVDYVPDSSATLVKNPNYWGYDPLHPGYRVPYLDGVKWLLIPDVSTQLAAMRTGKIDMQQTGWEDAESLLRTNPELQYVRFLRPWNVNIFFRIDTPPFNDIRVRKALALAVNQPEMVETYFGGNATLTNHPIAHYPEFAPHYFTLDEFPEEVREYWEYHPDKARQLLAEAGYPNGFKAKITTYDAMVDLLSVVKAYWADIGVDVELQVLEYGSWLGTMMGKKHEGLATWLVGNASPFTLSNYVASIYNASMVEDEYITKTRDLIQANVVLNNEKCWELMEEIVPYIWKQCWMIELPNPYLYTLWQPWVKGYHGEYVVGQGNYFKYFTWVWVDQNLKYKMTGRR